jgi:glutathione S-transferase
MMLRLYDYASSANCYKVRLLLAQRGLEYERIAIDIFAGETLTDEYARINPARTTPVLETEDGRYLPESNAILLYLADRSALLPDDPLDRAQVVRWLLYEQADIVPMIGGLRFRLLTGRLKSTDEEAIRRKQAGEEALRLLDGHLASHEFFVADRYTVADVGLYGYVHVASEAGFDLRPHGHLRSWLLRVEEQAGFVEDLEPYPANAAQGAGRSIYG